jgi:tetratricopeptide (TPR) repeat protein
MKRLIIFTILTAIAGPANAQLSSNPAESTAPEVAALASCTSLTESGKATQAAEQGKIAESIYRRRIAQNPRDVEALIGSARALSSCILPAAEFMTQGELSSEALELLDRALEIDPASWIARFILASISDRSPSFLGRGKRAAKEYDELLRMQGDRTDNPQFARVFAARGRQLSREGQADSAHALWARGARLFPDDSVLKVLTAERPAAANSPSPVTPVTPVTSVAPVTPVTPVLAQVEVVASAAQKVALPSVKAVTRSEVLMTAGGAADILQAVQLQPGAACLSLHTEAIICRLCCLPWIYLVDV